MGNRVLIDGDTLDAAEATSFTNSAVIGLSPAVSLGSNMLALAGALSRDHANATNQQQLNYMMAAAMTAQSISGRRSASPPVASEALDLLRQVVANLQAN